VLSEVVKVERKWRAALAKEEHAAMSTMTKRYLTMAARLMADFESLAEQVTRMAAAGEPVPVGKVYQLERFQRLATKMDVEFDAYRPFAEKLISDEQRYMLRAGTDAARETLAAAVNASATIEGWDVGIVEGFPARAAEALVGQTQGGPLAGVLGDATATELIAQEVAEELVQGVLLGKNPTVVAGTMADAFGVPLDRALCIARTEMLSSFRTSTLQSYRGSGLKQYQRMSAQDSRVCPGCLAVEGELFETEQDFDDHPNCRCSCIPYWPGIGGDFKLGKEWFDGQPLATQEAIMGKTRLDLLRSGKVEWRQLATNRKNATWGGAIVPTPIRDLRAGLGGVKEAHGLPGGPAPSAPHVPTFPDVVDPPLTDYTAKGSLAEVFKDGKLEDWRVAEHERILDELIPKHLKPQEKPLMQRLGGGSATGKSTMLEDKTVHVMGKDKAVVVDADAIKRMIRGPDGKPIWETMVAEGRAEEWAGFLHAESSYLSRLAENRALRGKLNLVTDGTNDGALAKQVKNILTARGQGYRVEGYFATMPTEVSLKLALARAKAELRHIDLDVILTNHESVSRIFEELAPYFDDLKLFDNYVGGWVDGHGKATLIAACERGGAVKVVKKDLYQQFLAKCPGPTDTLVQREGRSFELASRYVADQKKHSDSVLIQGHYGDEPHAWVKLSDGRLYDPVVDDEPLLASVFNERWHAVPDMEYAQGEIAEKVAESGHWGPWEVPEPDASYVTQAAQMAVAGNWAEKGAAGWLARTPIEGRLLTAKEQRLALAEWRVANEKMLADKVEKAVLASPELWAKGYDLAVHLETVFEKVGGLSKASQKRIYDRWAKETERLRKAHLDAAELQAALNKGGGVATNLGKFSLDDMIRKSDIPGEVEFESNYGLWLKLGADPHDAAYAPTQAARAKREIQEALARRLDGNAEWENMLARRMGFDDKADYLRSETLTGLNSDEARRTWQAASESEVNRLVHMWAQTSGDSDFEAIALQQAARVEFNLTDATMEHFASSMPSTARYDSAMAGNQAFLRAMYENTQEVLAAEGVDSVILFRGAVLDADDLLAQGAETPTAAWQNGVMPMKLQPSSSFSLSPDVAKGFSTHGDGEVNVVIAVRVPRSRVIGSYRSGYGCMEEQEFVVLGGEFDAVVAYQSSRTAGSAYEMGHLDSTAQAHFLKYDFPAWVEKLSKGAT